MAHWVPRAGFITVVLLAAACTSSAASVPTRTRTTSSTTTSTTAPPSTTTTSTTSTTTTSTTQPATALHKVVIVGDSIMFVSSKYVQARFQAAGIEANNQSFPGTSLLGQTNVEQTLRRVVDEQRPDVVIAEYSGVYLPPYPTGPDGLPIAIATPPWWDAWKAAAEQATRDLGSRGARVYWVLLPHDRRTWANHDTRMDDLYTAISNEIPNTGLIDWRWAVSGPYGAPVDQLPIGPNGAMANVRGSDGFHFSEDASNVLAGVTVATVLRDFGRG